MKIEPRDKQSPVEAPSVKQGLKVRSDLRAGATGCELGLNYWRKEYNYWKKLAQQMGCV